jgi:hypothetical protein
MRMSNLKGSIGKNIGSVEFGDAGQLVCSKGVERTVPINEWLCWSSEVVVLIKRTSTNADAFLQFRLR